MYYTLLHYRLRLSWIQIRYCIQKFGEEGGTFWECDGQAGLIAAMTGMVGWTCRVKQEKRTVLIWANSKTVANRAAQTVISASKVPKIRYHKPPREIISKWLNKFVLFKLLTYSFLTPLQITIRKLLFQADSLHSQYFLFEFSTNSHQSCLHTLRTHRSNLCTMLLLKLCFCCLYLTRIC